MIKLKDMLNEGSKNPANIKAYYEALCKNEKVSPLPVKFGNVGQGGAALTFNPKTMKPLYISFNVNRMLDPEYAVIHELTHQIKLETEQDAYLGKKDQSAKFKKLENKLVEKYMYSKFSNILYKENKEMNEVEVGPGHENDRDMVVGVAEILRMVDDTNNRKEIAEAMLRKFKSEEVIHNAAEFLTLCGL